MKFSQLIGLWLYIIQEEVSAELLCSRQEDCVAPGANRCSICTDKPGGSGEGICYPLFPRVYQPAPRCRRIFCSIDCGVNGECRSNDRYHTYCQCTPPYYGRDCRNLGASITFKYVRKEFRVFAELGAPTKLIFNLFTLRSFNELKRVDCFVKYDKWLYHYQNKQLSTTYKDGDGNFQTYAIKILFPYKPPSKVYLYKLGDTYIGYSAEVKIQLLVGDVSVFDESYDTFVSYENVDFNCYPKIDFVNCAENMPESVSFFRDSDVHIPFSVDYRSDSGDGKIIDENCNPSEKTSWRVYKLRDGVANYDPDYDNFTNSRHIRFRPFSIEIGNFYAEVEVTVIRPEKSVSSINSCFFSIKCKPLVAAISGGSHRMISAKEGLMLKAEKAYDPNMPPNDQAHLQLEWSCTNMSEPVCQPRQVKLHQSYFIPNNMITAGATYELTMKLWTDRYDKVPQCDSTSMAVFVDVRIEVAKESEDTEINFVIECILNCGTKVEPNRELFLKAKSYNGISQANSYEWTYFEGTEGVESVESIKVGNLPPYMLLIKEDTLKGGTNYTILAALTNSSLFASYSFKTDEVRFEALCNVSPNSGTKGLTRFHIKCEIENMPEEETLSFEFYDKNDNEANDGFVFSGRMLGASKMGELQDVRITRGNIIVYILNSHGLYLKILKKIELADWEINHSILMGLYKSVTDERHSGSFASSLRAVSFIPDIIPDKMQSNKSNVLNVLLGFLTDFSTEGTCIGDVKHCTSTLTNVLITMNTPKQLDLEPPLLLATMELIKHQAQLLFNIILSGGIQNMPQKEVEQVTISLLNSLHSGLLSRNKNLDNIDEELIDSILLSQLKLSSRDIESILNLITNALSYLQAPGHPATKISSNNNSFVVCVMEDDEHFGLPEILSREQDIKVEVSEKVEVYLKSRVNKDDNIVLQIVMISENIFWWSPLDVNTDLVSVSLKKHYLHEFKPIKFIKEPVTVLFDIPNNLKPLTLTGNTVQQDPNRDLISLDMSITIYRIDIAPGSIVSARFIFPITNGSLRVFAEYFFRPDFEMMIEKSTYITENSPTFNILNNQLTENAFIFIGILPGPEVPVNVSVLYTMELNITLCQRWEHVQWTFAGCNVKEIPPQQTQVRCDCNHFSIFSAAFPVPPNEINPFSDVTLFLTVLDNPLVVISMLVLLVLYLLMCFILLIADRKAKRKRNVILLADNLPSDKHPYLVGVYTSSRFNAGTSAHVGIMVIGSNSNSRCHILSCEERKILQSNSDDWFIIFTPEPLGDVSSVHIWHDNYGSSPKWFCNKIIVYDLLANTDTLFIINDWLSLQESEYPEALVLPAAEDDLKNMKSLFIDNFVMGLMENHLFMGCLAGHPRSKISKIQRLSILLCYTLVVMLCTIMFYTSHDEGSYVDSYSFSVGAKEMIVSIESIIISFIITTLVIVSFKRSYKFNYIQEKRVAKFKKADSRAFEGTNKSDKSISLVKSLYVSYIKFVSTILKPHHMRPVDLLHSDSVMEVRRGWLLIAWTSCISITLCCAYLIMLYGLKLGAVKSKKWLSSFTMAMSAEILIYAPIRIILLSTLMTMAVQRIYEVNTHRVAIDDVSHRLVERNGLSMIIQRRNLAMYKPLTSQQRNEILKKKRLRLKWWELIDFIISALFAIVISNIALSLWSSYYHSNYHLIRLAKVCNDPIVGQYFVESEISGMEKYLESTLVNVLYNVKWYQGTLLDSKGSYNNNKYWLADYTQRMLGAPQIRQLRVVYKPCGFMMPEPGKCIPRWEHSSEDKDLYGEHWRQGTWSDTAKADSPWAYKDDSRPFSFAFSRLYGASGVHYTHGGYVVHLQMTRKQTELRLAELREHHWQDVATRVVFIEFSLYNVNQDLYMQMTLMVEYTASGFALQKAQATSVSTRVKVSFWSIIYIVFLIVYLFRTVYLINHHGLLRYLSRLIDICRLLILVLGVLSLIIFTAHHIKSSDYSESFQSNMLENYFDFDEFVIFFVVLKYVISLLLFVIILHTILLLKAGRRFSTHVHSLKRSLNWIFWSFVSTLIITSVIVNFSICFNFFMPYAIRDLTNNKHSLKYLTVQESQQMSIILFVIFKTLLVVTVLWCFVIQLRYYVKEAKSCNLRKSYDFNFITFLVIQFNLRKQ